MIYEQLTEHVTLSQLVKGNVAVKKLTNDELNFLLIRLDAKTYFCPQSLKGAMEQELKVRRKSFH